MKALVNTEPPCVSMRIDEKIPTSLKLRQSQYRIAGFSGISLTFNAFAISPPAIVIILCIKVSAELAEAHEFRREFRIRGDSILTRPEVLELVRIAGRQESPEER